MNVWPDISSAVPEAELHVYYGFDMWLVFLATIKSTFDLHLYLHLHRSPKLLICICFAFVDVCAQLLKACTGCSYLCPDRCELCCSVI